MHEWAHAFVATKLGDPTPGYQGRLTLNPFAHIDYFGALALIVFGIGWAKPVPINPNNFDNYRKGCFWTSAAGILMNYFMAFLIYPIVIIVLRWVCPLFAGTYMEIFLFNLFYLMFSCSLSFCVFNLLPFYPLDGFRIVDALNKKHGKVYQFLRRYGYSILMGLIFIHIFVDWFPILGYIDILGYVMQFAVGILGRPITLLWDWVFGLIL